MRISLRLLNNKNSGGDISLELNTSKLKKDNIFN